MNCKCVDECYHLGCYHKGDEVDTGELASMAGDYLIVLSFLNVDIHTLLTLGLGDPIVFTHNYNEDYLYKFQIIDPSGVVVQNPDGGDWFCFTSTIKVIV